MIFSKHISGVLLGLVALFACPVGQVKGQIADKVYQTDYRIAPDRKGELRIEVDNISFFRDNEFSTTTMDGYTLPGLWLQPKAVYYPLRNMKLEAGVHMLRYWGTDEYPNMAYRDIARWKGKHQDGIRILPFFRAQVALSDHLDIVLGHLYGGANHQLVDPLYCLELNLTADPEAGLQVLYHSKPFDLDMWVNWESFIFREDTHQEAFIVGLSSRVKLNDAASRFHFYVPVQGVIQHRGGEIDTIQSNSVQTLMNGAVGLGVAWNINHRIFRKAILEAEALGYYQQAGRLWPLDSGSGLYVHASVDMCDFRIKGGYFRGNQFISLLGYPFFGCASTKNEGVTYHHPQTGYLGLEYAHTFAPGYAIGVDVDLFYQSSSRAVDPSGHSVRNGASTSFSAGIYLRVNPSFLIKKFGGE